VSRDGSRVAASSPASPRFLALLALGLVTTCVATGRAGAAPGDTAAVRLPAAGPILTSALRVHAAPNARARTLKLLPQFRADHRPTIVFAVAAVRSSGTYWLKIAVPGRPNGRTGWVRWDTVKLSTVTRKIVVNRSRRTLTLLERGRVRYRTRVAVGRPGMETPRGRFYIAAAFRPSEPSLGAYAFETSGYSKLSEWPGGGIVGIHGTPYPKLLGQAVSHGCIRVSNRAALTLKRLAPVGTEVAISG
jgi:lipoprotein-anchoring transpeptidase ErfK/SrfK